MTNIEIRKTNNLIEMLTSIRDRIPENTEKGFYAELEVTLDVTVNYLRSTLDGTPVKTNNLMMFLASGTVSTSSTQDKIITH